MHSLAQKRTFASSVDYLNEEINEAIDSIEKKIKDIYYYQKVVLIGNTGAGKSTLSCALMGIILEIVQGAGKQMILEGEGVGEGLQSYTQQPTLLVDNNHSFILCDCPGFEDTSGIEKEIINSFIIDNLFHSDQKYENKFTVLLVASESDLFSTRGHFIKESFERVEEMFEDKTQIEKGIGLVITKSDPNLSGEDYLDQLNRNAPTETKKWLNYFKRNPERVFVMPKPSIYSAGEKYVFKEKEKLIHFINKNYIVNPSHQIVLSTDATIELENLQIKNEGLAKTNVKTIFKKIITNLIKSNNQNSQSLNDWINNIQIMINKEIDNSQDLENYIKTSFTKNEMVNEQINNLKNCEKIDSFLNKVLKKSSIRSTIKEEIHTCLYEINEIINSNLQVVKEKEKISKINKEKEDQINKLKWIIEHPPPPPPPPPPSPKSIFGKALGSFLLSIAVGNPLPAVANILDEILND